MMTAVASLQAKCGEIVNGYQVYTKRFAYGKIQFNIEQKHVKMHFLINILAKNVLM